ncbi:MAG: Trm112 family protein [Gammaproteobacteria bacterium]|nr:Trm112 family protein [Pseudomonadales bacterium]MCP5346103.1 Trm112 family protein [Pseudomonadales bacterium]
MSLDHKLLAILVCPICKGELIYNREAKELVCRADRLAFPVKDDIPVMLSDEARPLSEEERERYQ